MRLIQETPISAETPTGAMLTAAEAARTLDTFIIARSVVEPQQEISHDVRQVPDRMQAQGI